MKDVFYNDTFNIRKNENISMSLDHSRQTLGDVDLRSPGDGPCVGHAYAQSAY